MERRRGRREKKAKGFFLSPGGCGRRREEVRRWRESDEVEVLAYDTACCNGVTGFQYGEKEGGDGGPAILGPLPLLLPGRVRQESGFIRRYSDTVRSRNGRGAIATGWSVSIHSVLHSLTRANEKVLVEALLTTITQADRGGQWNRN